MPLVIVGDFLNLFKKSRNTYTFISFNVDSVEELFFIYRYTILFKLTPLFIWSIKMNVEYFLLICLTFTTIIWKVIYGEEGGKH